MDPIIALLTIFLLLLIGTLLFCTILSSLTKRRCKFKVGDKVIEKDGTHLKGQIGRVTWVSPPHYHRTFGLRYIIVKEKDGQEWAYNHREWKNLVHAHRRRDRKVLNYIKSELGEENASNW